MPARRRQKRVTDDKKSGENAAFALLVFPPLPGVLPKFFRPCPAFYLSRKVIFTGL